VDRQHRDERVALRRQEVGEGEPMMAGELQADEHPGRRDAREQTSKLRVGRLEAWAGHQHFDGLTAEAVRPAGHEHVEPLAGIDAHVHRKRAGVGELLIGGHGRAPWVEVRRRARQMTTGL
jgi:hypothetical protein